MIVTLIGNSYQECWCNVRLRGEYCGFELNRRNGNQDCERHIYYCGRNNMNKVAILVARCPDESQCEDNQTRLSSRTRRRNTCLRKLQCHCRDGMDDDDLYCGNQLTGSDCPPHVLFRCRFSRNGVTARDACLDGCHDGKCLNGVDIPDNFKQDSSSDGSDTEMP
ncbi:unnamed protein product [Medioppia subpectinata]|uniref:Uncharacterized protein n=1 Tax=Medioppia subpectinata TaxID=1979941 RepID=A0A7R9KDH6_9ACAR|nr:unnamed protein product [Medioppia subpectinata]CAG2100614.1 unnamed protein product [Medioppia subpectinata]